MNGLYHYFIHTNLYKLSNKTVLLSNYNQAYQSDCVTLTTVENILKGLKVVLRVLRGQNHNNGFGGIEYEYFGDPDVVNRLKVGDFIEFDIFFNFQGIKKLLPYFPFIIISIGKFIT